MVLPPKAEAQAELDRIIREEVGGTSARRHAGTALLPSAISCELSGCRGVNLHGADHLAKLSTR